MTRKRPPIGLLFLITICGIFTNTLLTPNIPDVLDHFNQPDGRAGFLVAIAPAPGIILAPIMGVLADRYGRRRILLPCLFLFGIAGLATSLAPTFTLLLVARFFQGIGASGLINLAVVIIGDHWQGVARTKAIGQNSAVLTVCLALVPSLSGFIAEATNWRVSLALAGIGIPIGIATYRFLPESHVPIDRSLRDQIRGARTAIDQPVIRVVIVSGFLLFVVIFGVFLTALPVHLEREFGLGARDRGLILSVPAIGATVVALNLSRLRAWLGIRGLLVSASALISMAAFGVAIGPSLVIVVAASIIYGLGDGTCIPSLQDAATSAAPTEQRASVMAAWVAVSPMAKRSARSGAAAIHGAYSTTAAMLVGAAIFAAVAVIFVFGPLDDKVALAAATP
ncbi:MAG: MFS transporter [Acidimicrobiales bacterium]